MPREEYVEPLIEHGQCRAIMVGHPFRGRILQRHRVWPKGRQGVEGIDRFAAGLSVTELQSQGAGRVDSPTWKGTSEAGWVFFLWQEVNHHNNNQEERQSRVPPDILEEVNKSFGYRAPLTNDWPSYGARWKAAMDKWCHPIPLEESHIYSLCRKMCSWRSFTPKLSGLGSGY